MRSVAQCPFNVVKLKYVLYDVVVSENEVLKLDVNPLAKLQFNTSFFIKEVHEAPVSMNALKPSLPEPNLILA